MITNKQQQKIDKLLLIYGNKINNYIKQNDYKFSQEYFIQCVVASDPDSQGKSVKWILNNVLNGNILWEDVESGDESKVYDTLNRFYSIRNQFKDQSLRDINQFKRLGDIAEQLRGFEVIQSNKELKKDKKEQIYKDTIFLYNQNGYLVVVPKTQESSCFWGLGTEWCTAATHSENYFNHYNEKGPLYICITPNGKKYQFHVDSEPMDENDNPIYNITDPVLRKLAIYTDSVLNIKNPDYSSINEIVKLVKNDFFYEKNISFSESIPKKYKTKEMIEALLKINTDFIEMIDKDKIDKKYIMDILDNNEINGLSAFEKFQEYDKIQQLFTKDFYFEILEKYPNFYHNINRKILPEEDIKDLYDFGIQKRKDLIRNINYYLDNEQKIMATELNGENIQFLDEEYITPELCNMVINQDPFNIQYIKKDNENYDKLFQMAFDKNANVIKYAQEEFKTFENCRIALKHDVNNLKFFPENIMNNIHLYDDIENLERMINYLPEKLITKELCIKAFEYNKNNFSYIPYKYKNKDMYIKSIENNKELFSSIYFSKADMETNDYYEIAKKAIFINPLDIQFIDVNSKYYKDLLEFAFNTSPDIINILDTNSIYYEEYAVRASNLIVDNNNLILYLNKIKDLNNQKNILINCINNNSNMASEIIFMNDMGNFSGKFDLIKLSGFNSENELIKYAIDKHGLEAYNNLPSYHKTNELKKYAEEIEDNKEINEEIIEFKWNNDKNINFIYNELKDLKIKNRSLKNTNITKNIH